MITEWVLVLFLSHSAPQIPMANELACKTAAQGIAKATSYISVHCVNTSTGEVIQHKNDKCW